jgi:putative oxidoreductase
MRIFWPVLTAILVAIAVIALIVSEKFRARYFWRIVDLILGGIFIYAGVLKALDPLQFANDIDNYKALPWFFSVRLAFYLPWLEIFCGLAVIFRFLYRGGLSILTGLVTVFIGATVAAKMRGLDITCGCFGHASKNWSFLQHMAVDLAIFAGLVVLWFVNNRRRSEL